MKIAVNYLMYWEEETNLRSVSFHQLFKPRSH